MTIQQLHEATLRPYEYPVAKDYNLIPKGDMPGDKIQIDDTHIAKARTVFPLLVKKMKDWAEEHKNLKPVLSVHGGSGVGKSEIGALLGYYLTDAGLKTYVLSGDNYPRRMPIYNDAERLRIYRTAGMRALVVHGFVADDIKNELATLQQDGQDADSTLCKEHPWLKVYQTAAKRALSDYLGSYQEIDFDEINALIERFKKGDTELELKRMGREDHELWYDCVSMTDVDVLIIEWTHGNNDHLKGVDLPILLNSTPEETLEHRRQRNRDKGVDSPFTTTVLELEQRKLMSQAHRAAIIVTKKGELIDYNQLVHLDTGKSKQLQPMLNVYPDSIGGNLDGLIKWLEDDRMHNTFGGLYLLPSIFHSDLDRGFSVIEYALNKEYASEQSMDYLSEMGLNYKFDMVLNHASVLSPQFQDIVKNGSSSEFMDFFIPWNHFWEGYGKRMEDGHIVPDEIYTESMFFRKPGMPILKVRTETDEVIPFWNTFYQDVQFRLPLVTQVMESCHVQYQKAIELLNFMQEAMDEGKEPEAFEWERYGYDAYRSSLIRLLNKNVVYLGQLDLNVKSPLVWEFYEKTLRQLAAYGADIVRLDAFAYAAKEPGKRNFFNEPETWDILERLYRIAKGWGISLLPEIHASYEEAIYRKIAQKGYMIYDFFLPGLILDAFEQGSFVNLKQWITEILDEGYQTVNMLGCHDGIPLLDLKGLLTEDAIKNLIDTVVGRGGKVKDLHGKKNIYYQVNATYYSALGEDPQRMVMARAIQMFMPGKPQVWYLDILNGKNDLDAVEKAGSGGHKEINRTNVSVEEALEKISEDAVKEQLRLIQLRQRHSVFNEQAQIRLLDTPNHVLGITWTHEGKGLTLHMNLEDNSVHVEEN